MFESKSFYSKDGKSPEHYLDEWLNSRRDHTFDHFEIIGYQAFYKGPALGHSIVVTIKYTQNR